MPDLDTDTARIVSKLVDLQAHIADLTSQAEALKAELRALPVDEYRIDGKPVLRIIPNRRFDVTAAAQVLPENIRTTCLAVAYDPAKVKRHLSPDELDRFMVEAGKPKVTIL